MVRFILKRLGLALIALWILSVIVFLLCQVLPSDPGRSILGPLAEPSAVRALDHQLGVDKPVLTQYWHWITNFPGTSQQYQEPIGPILTSALGRSLKLGIFALVILVPLGIIGGVVSALNAGKPIDRTITVVGQSMLTVPEFVSGIVLIVVFAVELGLAAGHGDGPARLERLDSAQVPDPAGDPARDDPVRVYRAHGSGRDDRGARLRLRAHRDAQGPAARGNGSQARASQLPAADDHGDRDADRLPDRRPRHRRDAFPLQRHRPADRQRGAPARTSRCSRRAS